MKIHIPEPCHEDWGKMSPSEQGRFCGSCKKDVHDFTGMDDQHIVQTVSQPDAHICGRISTRQLQRINSNGYPLAVRSAAMLAIITSAGLSFLTGTAAAQDGMQVEVNNRINQNSINVTGTVISSDTGKLLPGIQVMVRIDGKDQYGAFTDEKGFFSLDIPKNEQASLGLLIVSDGQYQDANLDNLNWNDQNIDVMVEPNVKLIDMSDTEPQIISVYGDGPLMIYGNMAPIDFMPDIMSVGMMKMAPDAQQIKIGDMRVDYCNPHPPQVAVAQGLMYFADEPNSPTFENNNNTIPEREHLPVQSQPAALPLEGRRRKQDDEE